MCVDSCEGAGQGVCGVWITLWIVVWVCVVGGQRVSRSVGGDVPEGGHPYKTVLLC